MHQVGAELQLGELLKAGKGGSRSFQRCSPMRMPRRRNAVVLSPGICTGSLSALPGAGERILAKESECHAMLVGTREEQGSICSMCKYALLITWWLQALILHAVDLSLSDSAVLPQPVSKKFIFPRTGHRHSARRGKNRREVKLEGMRQER